MVKKIMIFAVGMLFLISLASCKKEKYVEEMFQLYLQNNGFNTSITSNSDRMPLGQYRNCDVACFHEKSEAGGFIDVAQFINVGNFAIRKPCTLTAIYVYNRKEKELLYISEAYTMGWLCDDDLLHIFYKYDQASDKFTGHNWKKSENFVWDLEQYRTKL